jgi:hypothetical protein
MFSANPFPQLFDNDCAHHGVNTLKTVSITSGSWPPPNTEVKVLYLPNEIFQISVYTSNSRDLLTLRQFEENYPILVVDLIKNLCKEKPVALSIVRRT